MPSRKVVAISIKQDKEDWKKPLFGLPLQPSTEVHPFTPPREALEYECSLCMKTIPRPSLFRLRISSPRSKGKGFKSFCIGCILNSQPLLPQTSIAVGTIVAVHPPMALVAPRPKKRTNFALPPRNFRAELERHQKTNAKAMCNVLAYALVYDTDATQALYTYSWTDDRVSYRYEDTLARSAETGMWWSLSETGGVSLTRITLDETKEFMRRVETSMLRGAC